MTLDDQHNLSYHDGSLHWSCQVQSPSQLDYLPWLENWDGMIETWCMLI